MAFMCWSLLPVAGATRTRAQRGTTFLANRDCVWFFATGIHMRLLGPVPNKPDVYDFKSTYDEMHNGLLRKDKEFLPTKWHFTHVGQK